MNLLLPVLYIWSLLYSSRCDFSDPCTKVLNNTLFCTSIPDASLYPPKLKLIIFKQLSGIETINNTVFNSSSLFSVTELGIVSSNIRHIEQGAFNSFISLAVLKLGGNRLTTINASWFSKPVNLAKLSLVRNQILAIEGDALPHFSNLVELDLSQNRIRMIADHSFKGNLKLSVLNLSNNELTFLRPEAFGGPKPQKISLYSNRWSCSCELSDFGSYLRDLMDESVLENGNFVTCNDPPNLKGIPVWNITDFHCPVTTCTPWPDQHTAPPILLPTLLGLLGLFFLLLLLVFLLVKRKQEKEQVTPGSQETIEQEKGPQQEATKENLSKRQSKSNREVEAINSILGFAVNTATFVPVAALGIQQKGEHALKTSAELIKCDQAIPSTTNVPMCPSLSEDWEGLTNRSIPNVGSNQEMKKDDGTPPQGSSDPSLTAFEEQPTTAPHSKSANNSKALDKPFFQGSDVMKQDRTGNSKPVGMIVPLSKLMSGNDSICTSTNSDENLSSVVGGSYDISKRLLRAEKLNQGEDDNQHNSSTDFMNSLIERQHSKESVATKKEGSQENIARIRKDVMGDQAADARLTIEEIKDISGEGNLTLWMRGDVSTTRRVRKGHLGHEAALFPGTRCDSAILVSSNSERTVGTSSPIKEEPLWSSECGYVSLLHEIVENQGRRTRERWKQTHRHKVTHKE
ncbi:uncharacterized protein LOC119955390 [Scyliorhinus canicula]|uniref:uncharacterized protein LOC119955390 n=1 Tax=Scyliorhinus canicula TaxID=7830 RepID=UPI0018F74605|nr:uncharacterized protein LOC119955390 [Scyliorhinus canicula]